MECSDQMTNRTVSAFKIIFKNLAGISQKLLKLNPSQLNLKLASFYLKFVENYK